MLVSIIIPIYNVASYVRECLQSVLHQTYRDLEVLLVDDCGTDESIAIIRSMLGGAEDAIVDSVHFRILHHKHNRGLSAARNTGIEAATGEWLFFLDSDDWIAEDCIATLVKAATQEEGIEMAVGQLETFDENGNLNVKLLNGEDCPRLNLPDGVYSGDILRRYLSGSYYEMAWNKLVSRSFLRQHDLYFKEGLIHEDTLWSFCCSCQLSKIAAVSSTTYHYRIQPGSIMAKSMGERRVKALNTILCSQIDYVITHGLDDSKQAFNYLFPRIKGYFLNPLYKSCELYTVDLYRKFSSIHFWSYAQLWCMVPAKRDFVPYLCRLLPDPVGLNFYLWAGARLWKA